MVMQRWRPRSRPFNELEELEHRMEDFFGRSMMPGFRRVPQVEEDWMPALDVYEKDDRFIVKAELPGMKMDDIDISVADGNLVIKGEKKTEEEVQDDDYYRCERTYGNFFRSIALPSNIDADKIEANYEDGILEISAAKSEESKPKKIQVSSKASK